MSIAYYKAHLSEFVSADEDFIMGRLTQRHFHDLEQQQKHAWIEQIRSLKAELEGIKSGTLYFEFSIPRMGKRADCVLYIEGRVFVLEYKVGSGTHDRQAIEQVHDYALDLKNFHRGSHDLVIVPILIATNATNGDGSLCLPEDLVATPICLGRGGLAEIIGNVLASTPQTRVDLESWESSGYLPTPTIVEAAQALYQNHTVLDIARSDASAKNLQTTSETITRIVDNAKRDKRKCICFVTGVPGAGKTLAGLNIATKRAHDHEDEHAVFLSGNGPLVDVLREALARDTVQRNGSKKKDAERKVRSFIQNIHHFRDEYLNDLKAPIEKVVVFDEAQRAWNKEQASSFMQRKRGHNQFNLSEPEFLIGVMDRHTDWCVIVCLIGGGQEINTGEAGITEWLQALQNHFPDWDAYASNLLGDVHYTINEVGRDLLRTPRFQKLSDLHLSVSMRSFRAESVSSFVSATLLGQPNQAQRYLSDMQQKYPIWLTRNIDMAKAWLRSSARGSERSGLVASSGALRLRPEGIHMKAKVDPPNWFLNDREDVRSSFYLEEAASEFEVQGLELDWVGVCWDANLRFTGSKWTHHAFKGWKWQNVSSQDRQDYLLNAYRVLLTRARQGVVIFVPQGNAEDNTCLPEFYDGTYAYLRSCGVPSLDN